MADIHSSSDGPDRVDEPTTIAADIAIITPANQTTASPAGPSGTSAEPPIASPLEQKDESDHTNVQDIAPAIDPEPSSIPSGTRGPLLRAPTEALGPAFEDSQAATTIAGTSAVLLLTLQLTTGARHPYKIDEKYLTNRKVEAKTEDGTFEPRELSGYKLKELIWTDWRSEWEPRPSSPSSIRLIYMGKLLDDKKALKEYAFTREGPNIVHMTIKPAEFDDEETAAKGTKSSSVRARDGEDRDAGCRCVIL